MFSDQFQMLGGASIFDSLKIVEQGWIDDEKVSKMFRQMERFSKEGFKGPVTYVWILWMIWGIDLWWRSAFPNINLDRNRLIGGR